MIDIYGIFKKIPGGSLLFPMFTVALINTIFPDLLTSFGGMTTAMYKTGTLTVAGIILFATGAGINVKTLGTVLKRCGALTIAKFAIAVGFGTLFVKMFGVDGIWGISAVAFVTVICSTSPGVFMGLAADYGEPADLGNFAVMNLASMPCFPIMILATATGGAFDIMSVITILVPFFLGMLLGNIDPNFAKMMKPATPILIPFMGACFGSSINLISALKAGLSGVLLAVVFLIINVVIMLFVDKIINRRPGYCGTAWCSVAGIAMTVPAMLAADPTYEAYIGTAGSQIALAIVITGLVSPFITKWVVGMWGSPKVPSNKEKAVVIKSAAN